MTSTVASDPQTEFKEDLGDALGLWWLYLIAGVLSLIVGIAGPLFFPKATLLTISILFGIWILVFSALAIYRGFQLGLTTAGGIANLFLGLLGLGAGAITIARPVSGVFAVALVLGYWWLITGVFELVHAIANKGGFGSALLGMVGIVAGLILIFDPTIAVVTLLWVFGITLIVRGVLEVWLSLQMRKAHKSMAT